MTASWRRRAPGPRWPGSGDRDAPLRGLAGLRPVARLAVHAVAQPDRAVRDPGPRRGRDASGGRRRAGVPGRGRGHRGGARVAPQHSVAIVSWTVLVDGAAVALGVAVTGGYRSPLLFLVFLDVMAVTLVASYRTGLKLARVVCAAAAARARGRRCRRGRGDERPRRPRRDRERRGLPAVRGVRRAVLRRQRARAAPQSRAPRAARRPRCRARARHPSRRRVGDARAAPCARLGFTRAVVLVRSRPVWDGVRDDGTIEVQFHVAGPTGAADRGGVVVGRVRCSCGWSTTSCSTSCCPRASNVVITPITADGEHLGVAVGGVGWWHRRPHPHLDGAGAGAGLDAHRARAAQRAAARRDRAPGDPRLAHRARQPAPVRRVAAARGRRGPSASARR